MFQILLLFAIYRVIVTNEYIKITKLTYTAFKFKFSFKFLLLLTVLDL